MLQANLEELIKYCKENKLGFASLQNPDTNIMVLVIGPEYYSPDTVSIAAANMLLTGVLTGMSRDENKATSGKTN